MTIDEAALLYGIDHIVAICNAIDSLKNAVQFKPG